MPKSSFEMAHFNKREAADLAIASLFATDYPDLELIFVDNASNDGATELLKKKYPRLKVIRNSSNRGSGGAWNTGFHSINPESKYVAFVDCDLVFNPRWLAEMVRVAESDPEIGGC